ncbi:MAG: DUF72 domain-containing protein [Alphaproteobacteria bacterium]|nr:DUF72 domain-containing protein [Alphaproteobacteria bacterium]
MAKSGTIRAGIGGWTFAPWRGTFYPDTLRQKEELHYASRQLATIEVNGTYYGSQKPATFAKWASETPDGFVFTLKGNRFVTNRKVLAESGESLERFIGSGITELGDRLGPLLWQFAPTKRFDPDDFNAFLTMLPASRDGIALKHAVEVRHESFATPEFVQLAAKHGVAIVYAQHLTYPEIADVTAGFIYARLQRGKDTVPTAYTKKALDQWAARAGRWATGELPDDLPLANPDRKPPVEPRDVYVYFIHEGKIRAPQAAMELQKRVA